MVNSVSSSVHFRFLKTVSVFPASGDFYVSRLFFLYLPGRLVVGVELPKCAP